MLQVSREKEMKKENVEEVSRSTISLQSLIGINLFSWKKVEHLIT